MGVARRGRDGRLRMDLEATGRILDLILSTGMTIRLSFQRATVCWVREGSRVKDRSRESSGRERVQPSTHSALATYMRASKGSGHLTQPQEHLQTPVPARQWSPQQAMTPSCNKTERKTSRVSQRWVNPRQVSVTWGSRSGRPGRDAAMPGPAVLGPSALWITPNGADSVMS